MKAVMKGVRKPRGAEPDQVLVIHPAARGLPTCSWWAEPMRTREEFDARVAKERPRIVTSRFARLAGSSVGL